MTRHIFALLALLGSVAAASAQGLTTMTVLDSTGTTKTYRMLQDASGRLSYTHAICDPTIGANAATNCATVTSGALTVSLPSGAATSALQSTINTTLGTPFQAGGSIGNTTFAATQATASNLKAQVDPLTAASWGLGATAAAVPANAHYMAINTGGNLVGWTGAVTNAGTFAVQAPITSWAGGTLGAMANYGTSPGAVLVPGANVFVTNTLAAVGNNADAVAAGAGAASPVVNYGYIWNGATWDRNRNGPYPAGAIPYTASATGTTGATTATLTGAASVTTYICGFSIRANATAAATGNATVTGIVTGTLNFTQWTAPNASGIGVSEEIFSPCVPASAANTSVAVVSAAPGAGGVVSTTAWGYKL